MSKLPTIEDSPQSLAEKLRAMGRSRAAWFTTSEGLKSAYPELNGIAKAVEANTRDFDAHEGLLIELGQQTGAMLGAFIHRTTRGQAAGGVRHWGYSRLGGFIDDGLRLSRGMGRKSALAGLWWGGGKGVIARQPDADVRDPGYRRDLYEDYGRFISSLRGVYVTAEDVGTTADDMAHIFHATRFVTCVPVEVGGSGNPSSATAKGVVCAMQGAVEHAGLDSVKGKTIAMQGAGNVAGFMIGYLLAEGVHRIDVVDISQERIEALSKRYPDQRLNARRVPPDDTTIFEAPCDIFAPNALGGVLNPDTIPQLRCKIVCGAANNQLLDDDRDGEALRDRGIVFVPDFVANRMGIVQCANEQYGNLPQDPAIIRHFDRDWAGSVHAVTLQVLAKADSSGTTATLAANQLADELSGQAHPLWPGRGRDILRALAGGWCDATD
jgi:glutamate dehydrogenase/leucine dehydrogenase